MISLIGNLFSGNNNPVTNIIEVRRMPPAKTMRAHLFGLSCGLLIILVFLLLEPFDMENTTRGFDTFKSNLNREEATLFLFTSLLIFIWFFLTSYFSGYFFMLAILFLIISYFIPLRFFYYHQIYFVGYLFGAVHITVYNYVIFLFLRFFEKRHIKISFAYDTEKTVNIIKSPIGREEKAFEKLVNEYGTHIKKQKNYQYQIDPLPSKPYTVAFVANPFILKQGRDIIDRDEYKNEAENYDIDPIIRERDLFLKSVDDALKSFELDEVMGRPEIWSRVRIITVFDEKLSTLNSGNIYGLIQEFPEDLYTGAEEPEENNILEAIKEMPERLQKIIDDTPREKKDKIWNAEENLEKEISVTDDIDIIIGLSGSFTHDRATAHFSDDPFDAEFPTPPFPTLTYASNRLATYHFDADPSGNKEYADTGGDIVYPSDLDVYSYDLTDPVTAPPPKAIHEYKSVIPGRMAINIYEARSKTFIHEFAHAMSSVHFGAIVDEYFDYISLGEPPDTWENPEPAFLVNRIDRNRERMARGDIIPVHKIFAKFYDKVYDSDLNHPSAEENWCGYFPDRINTNIPCTMDRTYGQYRFDALLSAFIYQRMMVKLTR